MEAIKSHFFSERQYPILLQKFKRINSRKYHTLSEYLQAIRSSADQINWCLPSADKFSNRDIQEQFMNGLPLYQRELIISRDLVHSPEEAVRMLEKNHSLKAQCLPEHFKNSKMDTATSPPKPQNLQFVSKAWCKYYKTKDYDDSKCPSWLDGKRKQLTTSEKQPNPAQKKSTYFIQEAKSTLQQLILEGTLNGSPAKFLVDTGSHYNIISRTLSNQYCKKNIKELTTSIQLEAINGESLSIKEETIESISWLHESQTTSNIRFLISDIPLSEIILGMEFLEQEQATINITSRLLQTRNMIVPLKEANEIHGKEFDEQILDKFSCLKIQAQSRPINQSIHTYPNASV